MVAASSTLPFVILLQESGIICHLSFYFAMLLQLASTGYSKSALELTITTC